jgi:hypothetical protein
MKDTIFEYLAGRLKSNISFRTVSFIVAAFFIFSAAVTPAYGYLAQKTAAPKGIEAILQPNKKSVKDSVVIKKEETVAVVEKIKEKPVVVKTKSSGSFISSLFGSIKKVVDKIVNFIRDRKNTNDAKYNAVVDELSKQSGLDKEVIEKAFSQLDKKQLESAVNLLSEMFEHNGNILSCGLYSLGAALNIPDGEAAFLALITDIKIGAFKKEALDGNYVYGVSAEAIIEVFRAFGYDKNTTGLYQLSLNNFMNSLQNGESAILMLNITVEGEGSFGHVVAVKKELNEKTGKSEYTITDNETSTVYTQEGFIKAVTGGERIDKNGNPAYRNDDVRYNAVKGGNIEVVTGSKSVAAAPRQSAMIARENADIQNMLKNIISLIKK